MLKILFDPQIFCLQHRGGISRYFCEIVKYFEQQPDISTAILPFIHQNGHLAETAALARYGVYLPYHHSMRIPILLLNMFSFEIIRGFSRPDIVHRTYHYAGLSGRHKQIITVHDLIPEKFPDCFKHVEHLSNHRFKAIMNADHIICNSYKTKQDLLEYYGSAEHKVSVVHMASSLTVESAQPQDAHSHITAYVRDPYILFIGGIRRPYKNFMALLKAIASSRMISRDFQLICLGGPYFSEDEQKLISAKNLSGRVIHMDGDDALLIHLYRNAELFVYPSIDEGFGIPIIEAMSLGCPVACSRISVFEEIAGGCAQFFDPHDEESIKFALEAVLYSQDRKAELKQMGFQNARRFSWKECAAQTLSIYRSL